MTSSAVLVLSLLSVLIEVGYAARILCIVAICGHSHYMLGATVVNELAARGHDVTFIAAYKQKNTPGNLREIVVDSCIATQDLKDKLYAMSEWPYLTQMEFVGDFGDVYTTAVLKDPQVQQLLNSDEHFDLVFLEHFYNEAFYIFPYKFGCPSVTLTGGPITAFNKHLVANPAPSSYVPNLLGDYGPEMNFWQRLKNTYINIISEYFVHFKQIPRMNEILHRHIPDAPELTDILYNTSMLFLCSHVSFGNPTPLQQNVKEIGGHHVLPPKPLPKDIQEFLDSAKDGVILFSMGSNLKSADFPEDKKKAVLKAFSKIKQKVLWKFETDLPEKPPNVKIMKWLPQKDVLAHPNVVAFISHSGLLGTLEAVYFGVPILGLPVFWDQEKNIDDVHRKGFGLKLRYQDLDEESFDKALTEILNNPKYLKDAKRRSRLMRDQPVKQMDEAVFWMEYVIRNAGAYHLRSPAMHLTWFQKYLVDVFAFVAAIVIFAVFTVYTLLRLILGARKCVQVDVGKKKK